MRLVCSFLHAREREKNVYYFREEQTLFFEEVSSAFLSRRRRCPFFSQKENKQSSFLSFASHKRDLRFKEKSHLTHRHYIKHDS